MHGEVRVHDLLGGELEELRGGDAVPPDRAFLHVELLALVRRPQDGAGARWSSLVFR